MGSVHDVIEAFRKAPSNAERGTKFEQLMVRYFELDPTMAQQYDAVWRWIDWPERRGRTGTGIDLVARERDTGNYTAIQCKFYEPTHTLAKGDIDSFFTASGKTGFTNRVIISTTDRWGRNAEDALADQLVPVQRIGMAEIAESPIDWDIAWPAGDLQVNLTPAKRHELRPHQQQAIDAVFRGFAVGNDRGKLIMACGTGKTFTALKIAERIAADNGGSARILLLVPSISLLSQTLREWTAQSELDVRAFAVCSDTKVSRSAEDYHVHDVPIPVTTDARVLLHEMAHRRRAQGLTVVFCTYQSLPTVAKAQRLGVDEFDLVMCDEAHRTTGVTLAGDDESNFVRVHDGQYLKAARRLYMTATPRIFTESIKDRADQHSAELVSMDDELTFGPEFHRLSFGEAVERGLLTDYKVMVLTVDQGVIAPRLQQELSGVSGELMLDDASKIVGCWNGLAKRSGTGIVAGEPPMRRAVAFAKDIKTSKQVAELFPKVVEAYRELVDDGPGLACSVRHVDGTFNALVRNEQLAWNTSFTVGFTGLARIDPAQKKSTSEWLAETLCDYASFEDGVDALRYWASGQIGQLPTGKGWEDKRLGIIIAGFDRRRIPLVAEISNFDPEAPIPANQNEFKCYRIRRAPGHSASFRITGAALTEKMYANILLRRVPRMLKQQDGITRAARLMVALQRRISEDNPGVGRHAMAVAIPRERTMPAVLSNLDAPSLNTMNSNFCYFDDAGFNYKQLGPHMAGGGWAWADFVAEADPSNPDMQKVGGRVLKCPQPPPQAESTGC